MKANWKYIKSWMGDDVNPTHDFELLKTHRKKQYEKVQADFIAEREANETGTSQTDLDRLYYKWLTGELNVIAKWASEEKSLSDRIELDKYQEYIYEEISKSVEVSKEKKTTSLTLHAIALIHHYEGKRITRENGDTIARSFGHTTGEGLFQRFTKYSSRQNRIGVESSVKKNQNKVKLFETVIAYLKENDVARKRAEDELKTFLASISRENK